MSSIKNLIAIDGNEKIVWNPELGHLETGEGDSKQTLLLTSRPYFVVKDVKLNPYKNLLALSGDNGITIVNMPRKWGRRYKSEKESQVYCNTFNVNERLFTCETRIRALHVDWHPNATESKQILCILTNDNKLRFHDVNSDLELQVIYLKIQSSYEDDEDDDICLGVSMLNLGESAICFDFGPPLVIQEPDLLLPIYILMGTGDVLLVYTNIHNPTYAEHIIGPLIMLPQAEDNYGSDACSLIVLDSSPPLLAMATPNGSIYHCFAFPEKSGPIPKQTLYVYESIELSKDLIKNSDDPYSPHPMKLFKDPTSEIRYFCVHQNGIHTVVLPILESIQSDCEVTEDKESFSEFVICTRTSTPSESTESQDDLSTPRGLGVEIRKANIVLLVLMPNNEMITQRISPATTLINRKRFPRHTLDASKESSDLEILNTSQIDASRANFEEQIQQIIKRRTNVPMLKLSEELEQASNVGELVDRTITTLKIEYIKKFNLAVEAIKKKLSILERDKQSQKIEYGKICKEKEAIYISVIGLSSKADIACQKQKELLSRIDKVLSAVAYGHPDLSEAESKLKRELTSLHDKLRFYRDQLDSIINKHKYHMNQKDPSFNAASDLMLSQTQLNGIKDTLSRQGADIAELKRIVKSKQSGTS